MYFYKEYGKTAPEEFENVSILFSDLVNFTEISNTLDPSSLIDELNDIFTAFDNIIEKYDCVRIKTIGDAINTASRLESHSEAMRINVSEQLYLLLKKDFNFEERGEIAVKGKGNIRMYFINGRI